MSTNKQSFAVFCSAVAKVHIYSKAKTEREQVELPLLDQLMAGESNILWHYLILISLYCSAVQERL